MAVSMQVAYPISNDTNFDIDEKETTSARSFVNENDPVASFNI